jgi:predicted Zn-dependent protease
MAHFPPRARTPTARAQFLLHPLSHFVSQLARRIVRKTSTPHRYRRLRSHPVPVARISARSRGRNQRPLRARPNPNPHPHESVVVGVMGDYNGTIQEIRTGTASTGAKGARARARGLAQGGRASECRTEQVAQGGRAETRIRSGAHGRGAVGGHVDVPR